MCVRKLEVKCFNTTPIRSKLPSTAPIKQAPNISSCCRVSRIFHCEVCARFDEQKNYTLDTKYNDAPRPVTLSYLQIEKTMVKVAWTIVTQRYFWPILDQHCFDILKSHMA